MYCMPEVHSEAREVRTYELEHVRRAGFDARAYVCTAALRRAESLAMMIFKYRRALGRST